MFRCANCGVGEDDNIKLKNCSACKSVKYCGVKCQKEHRPKHKRACKKRVAELRDEILFKQPESSCFGDCPICCLPMPLDGQKCQVMVCCGKTICDGCSLANTEREVQNRLELKCPFCRQLDPATAAQGEKILEERAAVNDPVANREMGLKLRSEGDYRRAMRYLSTAAKLGDAGAHFELGFFYEHGEGVEVDKSKEKFHFEEAAILGHTGARYKVGVIEWENGKRETDPRVANIPRRRAIKHWMIAAKHGHDNSMGQLRRVYGAQTASALGQLKEFELVSKDDLAAVLRAHQAAVDEMKSPQRETAEAVTLMQDSLMGGRI